MQLLVASPEPVKRANLCCILAVEGCFTQLVFERTEKHEHVLGAAAVDVKLFMWFVDLYAISKICAVRMV